MLLQVKKKKLLNQVRTNVIRDKELDNIEHIYIYIYIYIFLSFPVGEVSSKRNSHPLSRRQSINESALLSHSLVHKLITSKEGSLQVIDNCTRPLSESSQSQKEMIEFILASSIKLKVK